MLLLTLALASMAAALTGGSEATTTSVPRDDDVSSPVFRSVILATRHDLVSRLARRFGTDSDTILRLNPGLSVRHLREGQALLIESSLAAPPSFPDLNQELARGVRGRRHFAVTVDAAWARPEQIDALLGAIEDLDIPVTFFLTGIFIESHPDAVRRIADAGHGIGNHTWSHPYCQEIDDALIREELLRVEDAVTSLTSGTRTTRPYWRPPYGQRDERVLRAAAEAGFRSVYWTIDSLDWQRPDPPATVDTLFHRVCKRPFEKAPYDPDPLDGAIALFHMDGEPTPAALRRIVPHLRKAGYVFVSIDDLLAP